MECEYGYIMLWTYQTDAENYEEASVNVSPNVTWKDFWEHHTIWWKNYFWKNSRSENLGTIIGRKIIREMVSEKILIEKNNLSAFLKSSTNSIQGNQFIRQIVQKRNQSPLKSFAGHVRYFNSIEQQVAYSVSLSNRRCV